MDPSFAQDEHSPIGQCLNRYHLMPLSGRMEKYYSHEIDSDYQRSNEDTPELEDKLWLLERMVDFTKCNNLVSSHSIGLPMAGNRGHEKCGLHEEYMSRTQSSYFVVRGGSKGVRLETAVMSGNYIVDPLGTNEEHLHTWTNQTLTLSEVRPIGTKFVIKKPVGISWRHDMTAFTWDRENEDFILGDISDFENIDEALQEIRGTNRRMIQQLIEILHSGRPIEGAEGMDAMSKNMAMLSYDNIQEDYDMLDGEPRQLYMKLLTATGYEKPYRFLLDKFRDGEEIDTSNVLDFLLNMGNNVKSQALIEPIMDWVMHGLDDYPGLRSLAIINFARLATRVCMNPCGQEFLGDSSCGVSSCRQEVIDTFLPFITEGLNDESNDLWMRMVFMQALDNLHAEEIIPVLRPYVIGIATRHEPLRVTAMYALRRDNMPKAAEFEVFGMLESVFSNYQEYYRVREAALGMMLQWDPPASWWHNLAMSSWREPHVNMVAFINKIINTFKYSNPDVKHVQRLVKPAAPRSMYNSFITYDLNSNESDMLRYWYELMVSGNNEGLFPNMVFLYLRLGFINHKFNAVKLGIHADHTDLWNMFHKMLGFGVDNPHPDQPNVQDMYSKIARLLKNSKTDEEHEKQFYFIYTVFRSFQALVNLPVADMNMDDWTNFLNPSSILQLMGSMNFHRQFFINTGRITKGVATELGIPLMVQFSTPNLFSMYSSALSDVSNEVTNLDLDFVLRVDRLTQVTSRTLVPWNGKAMVSGLNSRMTVTLPFKHQIQYDSNNNYMHMTVMPNDEENTKELLGMSNEPFTVRAPFILTPRLSSLDDYSIVRSLPEYKENHLLWSETGLDFGAVFVGDVEPPFFTREKLQNFYGGLFMNKGLDAFKPTAKYYLWRFGANFEESQANSVTLSLHYDDEITDHDMDGFPVMSQSTVSIDLSFNMEDDADNRRYGSRMNWYSGLYDQRYASKIHLELTNLETSTCFNIQSQIPYAPLGTTTKDYFSMNNNMIFMILISQGDQCLESSPSFQLQGEFTVSEDEKMHLITKETHECDLETIRRDTHSEFFIPNYDQGEIQARWDQSLPLDTPFMSYMARVLVPGALFPNLQFSYHETDVEPGHATFTVSRNEDSWDVHFKKSTMEAEAHLHVHDWVENLFFSPNTLHTAIFDQFVVNHERLPFCQIAQDHIDTFDNVYYASELDRCWVVAVKDCGSESGVHTGMVMVRFNGRLEVRILWPAGGIKVDMGQDFVMINGQPVDAGTYDSLYKVHQFEGGMSVQLNQFVVVKVTDTITINVHPSERGSVCGVCGNYDDDERGDLQTPSGCIFEDNQHFVTSWKLPGDRCNNRQLKKEKRRLKEIESDCNMFSLKPSGEVMDTLQRSCYEYHYETRKQGPYLCTALMPTATCKSNCTRVESLNQPILYECKLRGNIHQDDQPMSDYQGDDPDYDYNYDDYDDYDDNYNQNQEEQDQYPEEVEEEEEQEEEEPEPKKDKKKDKKDKKSKNPAARAVRYGGKNLAEYPREGCHYYTHFETDTLSRCN